MMDVRYVCVDCGMEHDEPGEAILGMQVRCLDCQIEVDLAVEMAAAEDAALRVAQSLAA